MPPPKQPEPPKPPTKLLVVPVVIREGAGWSTYLVEMSEAQVKAGKCLVSQDLRAIAEGKAMRAQEER